LQAGAGLKQRPSTDARTPRAAAQRPHRMRLGRCAAVFACIESSRKTVADKQARYTISIHSCVVARERFFAVVRSECTAWLRLIITTKLWDRNAVSFKRSCVDFLLHCMGLPRPPAASFGQWFHNRSLLHIYIRWLSGYNQSIVLMNRFELPLSEGMSFLLQRRRVGSFAGV
jgi:hypothetical protein